MKIKFGSTTLQLVDNGAGESNGEASFIIQQNGKTFAEIESIVEAGLNDIHMLDDDDIELQSFNEYDTVHSINKYYNITVGGTVYPEVVKVILYRSNKDTIKELSDGIADLSKSVAAVVENINTTAAALTNVEENAAITADDITDIQLALADVYEMCLTMQETTNG